MRRSKFNVSKDKTNRTYKDIQFDSELEMKYYRDVVEPMLESGEITKCDRQVKYILQPAFKHEGKTINSVEYKADFVLTYPDGREQVIDTKGHPDSVALLKRKLFWYVYPHLDYRWIGFSKIDGGWCDFKTIQEGRKQRRIAKRAKVSASLIKGEQSDEPATNP